MKPTIFQIKQLQEKVSEGNQEAFATLYRLFFMRLFHFTTRYVHNRAAAEELVNDVMVKVWHRRSEMMGIDNLETYLFIAARNSALNYLSQHSPFHITLEPESGEVEIVNTDDPERLLEWREMYQLLQQAVDELPDQCRTVFKLIKEDGLSYKQVAEILDVSPRTVETQLVRAMKKLHNALDGYLENSPAAPPKNTSKGPSAANSDAVIGLLILFLDFY